MTRTTALFILLAGLNGLVAVMAGAWAAHGFGIPLVAGGDALVESGSRFQLWHALALLAAGMAHQVAPRPGGFFSYFFGTRSLLRWSGLAFFVGILGFSGGLYLNAAGSEISGLAPAGGAALMVGWALMALAGLVALFAPRD